MTDALGRHVDLAAKVLGVILFVQVLWLLVQWMIQSPPEVVVPPASSFEVRGVNPGLAMVDPNLVASLESKPLFWAGRQPYVAPEGSEEVAVVETATANTALNKTQLLGVYAAGNQEGAILAHQGQRLRLMVGESVDGWTLSSVESGGATFASGGESLSMELEHAVVSNQKTPRPVAKKRDDVQNPAPAQSNSNKTGA